LMMLYSYSLAPKPCMPRIIIENAIGTTLLHSSGVLVLTMFGGVGMCSLGWHSICGKDRLPSRFIKPL
jgi:hypothetical protein